MKVFSEIVFWLDGKVLVLKMAATNIVATLVYSTTQKQRSRKFQDSVIMAIIFKSVNSL
jgi:hypothetical protein